MVKPNAIQHITLSCSWREHHRRQPRLYMSSEPPVATRVCNRRRFLQSQSLVNHTYPNWGFIDAWVPSLALAPDLTLESNPGSSSCEHWSVTWSCSWTWTSNCNCNEAPRWHRKRKRRTIDKRKKGQEPKERERGRSTRNKRTKGRGHDRRIRNSTRQAMTSCRNKEQGHE